MGPESAMAQEKTSVNCGETLTIAHAMQLHQKLRKALDKSSHVELIANAITKVDTAGLQLLVSLLHEIDKIHGSITWKEPSPELIDAADIMGLTPHLAFNHKPSE